MPTHSTAPPRSRAASLTAAGVALALTVSAALIAASPMRATAAGLRATGPQGQLLTASAVSGLNPDGQHVTVSGSGYDATKGIYVALCQDNGPDRVPSPCLGGAAVDGEFGGSAWVVPPGDAYEGNLTTTYGAGGIFEVTLAVSRNDGTLDCAVSACAIVTRTDHRRLSDRSQDVRIPVTFAGSTDGEEGGTPPGTVRYTTAQSITTAGKPVDMLVHPDSGHLYVSSGDVADTSDVNEGGVYALDPADGSVRGRVLTAPSSTGAQTAYNSGPIGGALPGDGVLFLRPLRGINTATSTDTEAAGIWVTTPTVTDLAPGTSATTSLIARGTTTSEITTATGEVLRSVPSGSRFAVDAARGILWSTGGNDGVLRKIDLATFTEVDQVAFAAGNFGLLEVEPGTGQVWLGAGKNLTVLDPDGDVVRTLTDVDAAKDVAFDAVTGQAFVVWQDGGQPDEDDNTSTLRAYDLESGAETAAESLPANHSQLGSSSIAVVPGGATVFVTNPSLATIHRLTRSVSPTVTTAPDSVSPFEGDKVVFTAAAEAQPAPTVRWQRRAPGATTWTDIEGATSAQLHLGVARADNGTAIRAVFTNPAGSLPTAPADLTVRTLAPASAPTLSGTPRVGAKLRAVPGTWPARTTVTYQWLRDGRPIAGATTDERTLTPEDRGRRVSVRVDGRRAATPVRTASSAAVTIAAGRLVLRPRPKVAGRAVVGRRLAARPGGKDAGTTLTFRWLRSGKPIAGAAGRTYRLTAKDRGTRIRVRVVRAKPGYTSVSRTSAPVRVKPRR